MGESAQRWSTADEIRFLRGLGRWSMAGQQAAQESPRRVQERRIELVLDYLEHMDQRDPRSWGLVSRDAVFHAGTTLLEQLEDGEDVPWPQDEIEEAA